MITFCTDGQRSGTDTFCPFASPSPFLFFFIALLYPSHPSFLFFFPTPPPFFFFHFSLSLHGLFLMKRRNETWANAGEKMCRRRGRKEGVVKGEEEEEEGLLSDRLVP